VIATFGSGQVAYSLLWFFLFFIEIWLMISIFVDIFRSHDLRGWKKASWIILVIVFPLIGIVAYLIFRGDKMRAHQTQAVADQESMLYRYLTQAGAGRWSKVDELGRLAQLRDRGHITQQEFEGLKGEILDGDASSTRSD
jgi:hypothetical protein